jgi:GT2 family glycosyltransferase/ubiquinone/menaquinone biosynthesis C-methylase UbiE
MYGMSENEVRSLKRSWSYRVGRVLVSPASAVKLTGRYLRARRPATESVPAPRADILDPVQLAERYAALVRRPLISILLPVYETDSSLLRQTLESVDGQAYLDWQLCICDDASTRRETVQVLERFAAERPERVRLVRHETNRGIALATNAAAELADGEFVALLDHDDLLTPDALLEMALRLQANPDADLLYSDEDKITLDGRRVMPFFKPDFSPELFLTNNYLCHFTVIRRSVFQDVGGFREGFDGSQDYELFLRVSEKARRIEHVPRVLYHWRMSPGSAAADASAKGGQWRETSRRALEDAIERRGLDAKVENGIAPGTYRVRHATDDAARVTIIIPTRDKVDLLRRCVDSILAHTQHPTYEILVISNGSEESRTYEYLDEQQQRGVLRYLRFDEPFNFSRLNNHAARHCDSPYLLFMNNDVEIEVDGWLRAMLEHAQNEQVGAVGAKLLYPDRRVQHAGVVLGVMGVAGHCHRGLAEDSHGYFGQVDVVRNYSAVTAACLLTRREVFEDVKGFSEELEVAFNDVDFCLKCREAGYRVVYTPYARLVHHESASRGRDDLSADKTRFHWEIARVLNRWGGQLYQDPYYNPNLTLWREDFSPRTDEDEVRVAQFRATISNGKTEPPRAPVATREQTDGTEESTPATPRFRYKSVWNGLSTTADEAKMHVLGSADEADVGREARRTLEVLQATVGIEPDDVVVEIGCGVGRVGSVVAPICRKWYGCDVSGNMLRYARQRLADRDNVEFVEVSGFDLEPIGDASVDVVYCTVVMMHLDEWDRYQYIREAHRVLRPGGRIYVDNVNLLSEEGWGVFEVHRDIPPERRPPHITKTSTPEELGAYLQRAEFKNIRQEQQGLWVRCWAVR